MTRWQIFVERRWRCARDLSIALLHGAVLRIRTRDGGLVTAGQGAIYDWRAKRSGDLVCKGEPAGEVAIRLTGEFDVPRLRRALREARARA